MCSHLRIFMPFRFYMKSLLNVSKSNYIPFWWFWKNKNVLIAAIETIILTKLISRKILGNENSWIPKLKSPAFRIGTQYGNEIHRTTLTLFWQKFRENNDFTKVTKELISRKIPNFSHCPFYVSWASKKGISLQFGYYRILM